MKTLILIHIFLSGFLKHEVHTNQDTVKSRMQTFAKEKGFLGTKEDEKNMRIEKPINAFKRDTAKQIDRFKILFIVNQKGKKTIQTNHIIYSLNTIIDEHLVSKSERERIYHTTGGVNIINLKPDVKLLTMADIYKSYKISQWDERLPVYVNFHKIVNPNGLIAVNGAIHGVTIETDIDKFRFLNIITNEWYEQHKSGEMIIHLR